MNIFLFGSEGQLGRILHKELLLRGHTVDTYAGRIEDLTFMGGTSEVSFLKHDAVINCIAVSNTRTCEANWSETFNVNARFPVMLAKMLANDAGPWPVQFQHVSTGCIYDGNKKPIYEGGIPTPLINYARQKHAAELVMDIYPQTMIVRPRMIFSDVESPANLLYKIANFTEFISESNSMTCVYDLVNVMLLGLEQRLFGVYHTCNEGMSNPLQIKKMMNDILGKTERLTHISKGTLLQKMNGLKLTNTWIASNKLSAIYNMPPVTDRLQEMITKSAWLK